MKKNSDNISLGILDVIAIVFIILKLLDIIAWSWNRGYHLGARTYIPIAHHSYIESRAVTGSAPFYQNAGVVQCINQEIFRFGSVTQ